MRTLTILAIVAALTVTIGCAKEEPVPAPEPETPVESQEISNEDFETGEVDGVVEGVEDAVDEDSETEDPGDTP